MKFFIPAVEDPDNWEVIYKEFAEACNTHPLPHGKRIRSITFPKSTVETWTAAVGKKLSGTKMVSQGKGADRREYPKSLSDGATVLAIFPGVPYMVLTNKNLDPTASSQWANPFLAHKDPTGVEYFETEDTLEKFTEEATE